MHAPFRHAAVITTCTFGLCLPAWAADQLAAQAVPQPLADTVTIPVKVGGFIDVVGLVGVFDDNNPSGNAAFGADHDHVAPIFKGQGELQVGGRIDSEFSYQIDYELATTSTGGTSTRLEQAYIRYDMTEETTLKAGRFEDWIGFERNDSPTWYRTRLSPLAQLWHGIAPTGVDLGYLPDATWRFDLYAVNGIWSETGIGIAGAASKRSEDIGYGASVTWRSADRGEVKLGAAYDQGTHLGQAPGDAGRPIDTWAVFLSGRFDGIRDRTGLFFFWDLEYVDYKDFAGQGAMVGAMLELTPRIGVSFAATYVDPSDADDAATPYTNPYNTLTVGTNPATGVRGGTYGRDDELTEYCLSLHTRLNERRNVIFNVEVAYQDHAQLRGDVMWLDLELILVFP
jgi:hypothetical protein